MNPWELVRGWLMRGSCEKRLLSELRTGVTLGARRGALPSDLPGASLPGTDIPQQLGTVGTR